MQENRQLQEARQLLAKEIKVIKKRKKSNMWCKKFSMKFTAPILNLYHRSQMSPLAYLRRTPSLGKSVNMQNRWLKRKSNTWKLNIVLGVQTWDAKLRSIFQRKNKLVWRRSALLLQRLMTHVQTQWRIYRISRRADMSKRSTNQHPRVASLRMWRLATLLLISANKETREKTLLLLDIHYRFWSLKLRYIIICTTHHTNK